MVDCKTSPANPNTEADPCDLFSANDVPFLSKLFSDVNSVACGEFLWDLRGVPRFVGDCIGLVLSSEPRRPVLVAMGDVWSFGSKGFLTGVFAGEAGNDFDPEFPWKKS